MKTVAEKAAVINRGLTQMYTEYLQEQKPNTATRVHDVKVELMAQPEVAARLYDILMQGEV